MDFTHQSAGVRKTCCDAPTGRFLLGIRQFNSHEWYECHETIEQLWITAEGEVRNLYQGIIQIAIALHHWRNGNFTGAVSLLESGVCYLKRTGQVCLWVDVVKLIEETEQVREQLVGYGAERMYELREVCIPQIRTVSY